MGYPDARKNQEIESQENRGAKGLDVGLRCRKVVAERDGEDGGERDSRCGE